MEKGILLSHEAAKQLKEMLEWYRRLPKNAPAANAAPDSDAMPPEVYVAKTPAGGIPAASGTRPGYADCDVYRMMLLHETLTGTGTGTSFDDFGYNLEAVYGFSQRVHNLSTTAVAGASYVLIEREKFGFWFAVNPPSAAGGTGITSINGVTSAAQTLTVTSSGTDFTISEVGSAHRFNLPDAGKATRGLLNAATQNLGGSKTIYTGASGTYVGLASKNEASPATLECYTYLVSQSTNAYLSFLNQNTGASAYWWLLTAITGSPFDVHALDPALNNDNGAFVIVGGGTALGSCYYPRYGIKGPPSGAGNNGIVYGTYTTLLDGSKVSGGLVTSPPNVTALSGGTY